MKPSKPCLESIGTKQRLQLPTPTQLTVGQAQQRSGVNYRQHYHVPVKMLFTGAGRSALAEQWSTLVQVLLQLQQLMLTPMQHVEAWS